MPLIIKDRNGNEVLFERFAYGTPKSLLERLGKALERLSYGKVHLDGVERNWGIGFATHPGFVREKNEDFAVAFSIGDVQVGIVADGLSHPAGGWWASRAAVLVAAWTLARGIDRSLRSGNTQGVVSWPHRFALQAVHNAARILEHLRQQNPEPFKSGRTTLICVVATRNYVGWAHIGDGALWLLRPADASFHSLIQPQRLEPHSSVVTGSLGFPLEGVAECGVVKRVRGDFIVVCTDGVSDYVVSPPSFCSTLLAKAIEYKGRLHRMVPAVLAQMAALKTSKGFYRCLDNLSLVVLCDGQKPEFCEGFWKRVLEG